MISFSRKKLAFCSALFAGLISSSAYSAISFNCGTPTAEFKGILEDQESASTDDIKKNEEIRKENEKRAKKGKDPKKLELDDHLVFETKMVCEVEGKASTPLSGLEKKYLDGLRNNTSEKRVRKEKPFSHMTIDEASDPTKATFVHDRKTKHGHLKINAEMTFQNSGGKFETVYKAVGIDGDGNAEKYTKGIEDTTTVTESGGKQTVVFKREVRVKDKKIIRDAIKKNTLKDLPSDIIELSELHEQLLNSKPTP